MARVLTQTGAKLTMNEGSSTFVAKPRTFFRQASFSSLAGKVQLQTARTACQHRQPNVFRGANGPFVLFAQHRRALSMSVDEYNKRIDDINSKFAEARLLIEVSSL
jgi:hypothetical protein